MAGMLPLGRLCAEEPTGASTPEQLREQLQSALAQTGSPSSIWGARVDSLRTGETWFATNAAAHLIPASNAKLFTAALFLDLLGPEYRFRTSLRIERPPSSGGTLEGPLLIVGGGDPTCSARWYEGRWESAFTPFVDALRKAGIRRIRGDLLCDESRFNTAPFGRGWDWDDLALPYGAAVSALSAEDNCVGLRLQPGLKVGDPAIIEPQPLPAGLEIRSRLVTIAKGLPSRIDLQRLPGQTALDVAGSVPLESGSVLEQTSVPVPARWFGELLREALRRQGITVDGQVVVVTALQRQRDPTDLSAWREIASVPSLPAGDVVREMMKSSQNLHAQLLFLSVGAEQGTRESKPSEGGFPKTTDAVASLALEQFLQRQRIPTGDVLLEEGSGLSRRNLATPRAIVQLLQQMPKHRWSQAWMESFPVGGIDGTLQRRFTEAPTLGNVRAKTGGLRHAGALSGYLTNSVGEPLAFSVMVNGYVPTRTAASARDEIDRWVEILARSRVR